MLVVLPTKTKGQTKNSVAETITQISQQVVEQPAPIIQATVTTEQTQPNTQLESPPEILGDVEDVRTETIDISPDLSIQVELPETGIAPRICWNNHFWLIKFVRFDNRPEPDPTKIKGRY